MANHSVFGPAAYPVTLIEGSEPPSIIVVNGFYTFTGGVTGWQSVGARLYVPAGVTLPGSILVGLWAYAGGGDGPDLTVAPDRSAILATAVEGWNEVSWAPLTVVSGTPFWLGYDTGDGSFLVNLTDLPDTFVNAWDGAPLVLGENNIAGLGLRSYFRIGAGAQTGASDGPGYGIDALVQDTFGADVYVSDSFNRADAATLGRADTGQEWNATDWGISGNAARRGGGPVNAVIQANIPGDHYTELNTLLSTYTTGNQLFGPITNYADDSNFILLERVLVPGSEDAVKLYVQVGGVFNERGIFGGGPGSTGLVPTDPLTLRIERDGTGLSCLVNGTPVISYTLTGGEVAALGTAASIRNEGVLDTVFFDSFEVALLEDGAAVTGTADLVAPPAEIAASGSSVVAGATTLDAPAGVLTVTGAPVVAGTAALAAPAAWITAFGSSPVTGSAALTAPAGRLAASEEVPVAPATDAPCNVWEPTWCVDASTLSPGVIAATGMALEVASDLLWTLSGRRYGTCTVTSRPCAEDCAGVIPFGWQRLIPDWGGGTGWPWPALIGGRWFNLGCGVCQNTCSCGRLEQFELPYPTASIVQIKVDGVVLSPDAYRVDNHRYVVRVDGGDWPRCNDLNLPDTSPGTWSVTAQYGVAVPPLGGLAVGELALEIAKYCAGDDGCKISTRVQQVQRQGVTKVFVDPNKWREQGLTGLLWVDQFIAAKNPTRAIARAKIFDIDGPRPRITGTGG